MAIEIAHALDLHKWNVIAPAQGGALTFRTSNSEAEARTQKEKLGAKAALVGPLANGVSTFEPANAATDRGCLTVASMPTANGCKVAVLTTHRTPKEPVTLQLQANIAGLG